MAGRYLSETALDHFFISSRASLNECDGLIRIASGSDEGLGNVCAVLHAHQDDQSVDRRVALPVFATPFVTMAGNHGKGLRNAAVRERDAGQAGNCNSRSDAWDQFNRNTGLARQRPFFRSAPKYQRIAAF